MLSKLTNLILTTIFVLSITVVVDNFSKTSPKEFSPVQFLVGGIDANDTDLEDLDTGESTLDSNFALLDNIEINQSPNLIKCESFFYSCISPTLIRAPPV